MQFTHDTVAALGSAAALVNTATAGEDTLLSAPDLAGFVVEHDWSGPVTGTPTELAEVRVLRDRLRALWERDVPELAEEVNALLEEHHALPRLVDHDGWGYHLHATPDDAPLASRMAVEAAMALLDVVRGGQTDRLRSCQAAGCGGVLADLSRNRSRRWCSNACANRVNVGAFRNRHRDRH